MRLTRKRSWSILLQTVTGASRSVFILFIFLTTSAHAIVDTNENGLSDLWEKHVNNGNLLPNLDPQADPDGDGWTNQQEASAGTHLLDSNPPDGIPDDFERYLAWHKPTKVDGKGANSLLSLPVSPKRRTRPPHAGSFSAGRPRAGP